MIVLHVRQRPRQKLHLNYKYQHYHYFTNDNLRLTYPRRASRQCVIDDFKLITLELLESLDEMFYNILLSDKDII